MLDAHMIAEVANNKATLLSDNKNTTIGEQRAKHKQNHAACFALLLQMGARKEAINLMEEFRNTTTPSSLSLGKWWSVVSETTSLPPNTRQLNTAPSLSNVFALPLNQISPSEANRLQQALGSRGNEDKENIIPISTIIGCLFAASQLPSFKNARAIKPRTKTKTAEFIV